MLARATRRRCFDRFLECSPAARVDTHRRQQRNLCCRREHLKFPAIIVVGRTETMLLGNLIKRTARHGADSKAKFLRTAAGTSPSTSNAQEWDSS